MVSWVSVSALLVVAITLAIMSTAEARESRGQKIGRKTVHNEGQKKNTARRKRKQKKNKFKTKNKSKKGKASKHVGKKSGKANTGRATKKKIEDGTKISDNSLIEKQRKSPRLKELKFKHCDYLNLLEVGYRARSDFDCKAGDKFLFKVTVRPSPLLPIPRVKRASGVSSSSQTRRQQWPSWREGRRSRTVTASGTT